MSFVLLVFSGLTRIGNDVVLLGLSVLAVAAWVVLAFQGRPR